MKYKPKTLLIPLAIIDKPASEGRTVLVPSEGVCAFVGDVDAAPSLVCGQCGNVLAKKVAPEQLSNLVIQCFKCKAYNQID